jgi:hypothetical protein
VIASQLDRHVARLLDKERWQDAAQLLELHPELQTRDGGDRIGRLSARLKKKLLAPSRYVSASEADFDRFLYNTGPDVYGPMFAELFERCGQIGCEAAFAESGRGWARHPLIDLREKFEYKYLSDEYIEELEGHALAAAAEAWRKLADDPRFPSAPVSLRIRIWRELGQMLCRQLSEIGSEKIAQRAVDCLQQAVDHSEAGSPESGVDLGNLASALTALFEITGRVEILDHAVDTAREALAEAPEECEAEIATTLGALLSRRFKMNGARAVLDEGIRLLEHARELDSLSDPNNLAIALADRFQVKGDPRDLIRSTELFEESWEWTKGAVAANNLAGNYRAQYARSADEQHLRSALKYAQKAVDLSADDDPDLPSRLTNLITVLTQHGNSRQLARAIGRSREVSRRMSHPATLQTIRNWGEWAASRRAWKDAADAYQLGADRIRALLAEQALEEHKRVWLRASQGIAREGAYALAKCGRLKQAAGMMEQGRAVLARERLRGGLSDVDVLARTGDPKLVEKYRAAASRLRELRAAERRPDTPAAITQRLARDLRIAEKKLETVLDDIGGAGITKPLSATLVYLCAAAQGGVALVLDTASNVDCVWLPALTTPTLQLRLERYLASYAGRTGHWDRWRRAIDDITRWLWDAAVHPIIKSLRGHGSMILAGAGPLGLLPLHASWTPDRTRTCRRLYALDEIAIITAASRATAQMAEHLARGATPQAISVFADPRITGAKLEARAAAAGFTESRVLSRAPRVDVLSALAAGNVWHFACHGYAAAEPLDSALLPRQGEPVTVRDILSLPPAAVSRRLAVLSACETAVIDGELPDEAISMSDSLLEIGVAGVIGSLWAVPDDAATPLLMARFYELWRGGKLEPAAALRQAQRWLRDATNGEKQGTFPALAKIGLRGGPRARCHASPYYWAAFTYRGA